MEVVEMELSDLREADYNPRIKLTPGDPEYENLKRSIMEFGYVDPLVFNQQTGRLVGGHQRLQVLRDLGWTSAQVVLVDEPPEREKALNLALNNPNLQSDWDLERLRVVVDSLDQEMVKMAGFYDGDVAEMMRIAAIDRATDFLGDDIDPADKEGPGAPGLRGEHPHREGPQYFTVNLVLTAEQRESYFTAVNAAKQYFAAENTMDALVRLCQDWVDSRA